MILTFRYIILKEIVHNDRLSKNKLAIHEKLKELIIILIFVVRLHFLDFDIKLSFDFKIESCEDINDFILDEYSFNSHIADKIIHENCDNMAQKKNHYELLLYENSKLKKKKENY